MKNVSVSIGLSAYNEEKNIKNILRQIVSQKRKGWSLKEILVYCDGCSDQTVKKASEINNSKIRVMNNQNRKGKVFRLNQILRKFKGDILIIFDADLKLRDSLVINNLISPFSDKEVMLVGGNSRNLPPKTFFQRAVESLLSVYFESRNQIKGGHNIYGFTGACMVFRKKFAKSITLPDILVEDDYIYLLCVSKNLKFRYAHDAVVYYKLPNTLKDYIKQVFRSTSDASVELFKSHFGALPEKEFKKPTYFYLKSILSAFLKNPLGVSYLTAVRIICKPLYPFITTRYKISWYTAESTK